MVRTPARTVWSDATARLWNVPAATSRAFRPETSAQPPFGSVGPVPSPSWPTPYQPQAYTVLVPSAGSGLPRMRRGSRRAPGRGQDPAAGQEGQIAE
jgi:hypothetical protein